MGAVDWILNLSIVLLWLGWKARGPVSHVPQPGQSLLSTLKPTSRAQTKDWALPVAMVGLILVRSLVYWNIGTATGWNPSLSFGAISITFRSDKLPLILLYSILVAGLWLICLQISLTFLLLVNQGRNETEGFQRSIRFMAPLQARLPGFLLVFIPFVTGFLLWLGLGTLFLKLGLVPKPVSNAHFVQQAAVVGVSSFLIWRIPITLLLGLYLLNSYVYLGNALMLNYASSTARLLLIPLRYLPLRLGKLDLTPLAGMAVVFGLDHLITVALVKVYLRLPL